MTTYTSLLPKTGQTTSYVTGDDGDLQKGVARSFTVLNTGQYSGTTNITMNSLTEAHSNNCVLDNVTGLMWSIEVSHNIGVDFGKGAIGIMPWTTDGDGIGIFPYKDSVNTAGLAGYSDWRIPNINELFSIVDHSVENFGIFSAFNIVFYMVNIWSSTTSAYRSDFARYLSEYQSSLDSRKIINKYVLLVRGDPEAPSAGGGGAHILNINVVM